MSPRVEQALWGALVMTAVSIGTFIVPMLAAVLRWIAS